MCYQVVERYSCSSCGERTTRIALTIRASYTPTNPNLPVTVDCASWNTIHFFEPASCCDGGQRLGYNSSSGLHYIHALSGSLGVIWAQRMDFASRWTKGHIDALDSYTWQHYAQYGACLYMRRPFDTSSTRLDPHWCILVPMSNTALYTHSSYTPLSQLHNHVGERSSSLPFTPTQDAAPAAPSTPILRRIRTTRNSATAGEPLWTRTLGDSAQHRGVNGFTIISTLPAVVRLDGNKYAASSTTRPGFVCFALPTMLVLKIRQLGGFVIQSQVGS
ncbi:hypothetical protein C7974DRAFT_372717 [Boeremia exigua]|uniref:uncharacterized protein n=1 Tax=Boeremia exigua TaxID=749465 RepID=UPI001E8D4AF7|nr:uncharacterized protein C7974DRAFT_372717 [Boeremia exigua]KAH6642855.1 hypothetical protein C7974DRAFT_372717 [Boeremia exigua]